MQLAPAERKPPRFNLWALCLITGLGTCLRFYALSRLSMWLDEAWRAAYAQLPWLYNLRRQEFFFLIQKIIGHCAGYTETSMRFVPAMAGSLLIPSSYFLARRFISERGSLIVSGLVSLSPIAIVYSQENAVYSLLMLTITLSLIFLVDYIDTRSRKDLLLFLIAASFAISLHVYSVMIAMAMVAYFCATHGFHRRHRDFYLAAVGLALMSIWRISADLDVAQQLTAFRARNFSAMPTVSCGKMYGYIQLIVMSWFQGPGGYYTPQSPYAFMRAHDTAIAVFIFAVFALSVAQSLRHKKGHILLITFVATSYLLGVLYFGYTTGNLHERYCLPLMPLCFILFVRAFHQEAGAPAQKILGNLIIGLLFLNFATIQFFNPNKVIWKSDWRKLCRITRLDADNPRNKRFAIFVPVNTETTLINFYLPDLTGRVLTDHPFYSYMLNPAYIWLTPAEIRRFHSTILNQAKKTDIDVLYAVTEGWWNRMDDVTQDLSPQFVLEKIQSPSPNLSEHLWPRVYVYRRQRKSPRVIEYPRHS